jgi:hypothetical protein
MADEDAPKPDEIKKELEAERARVKQLEDLLKKEESEVSKKEALLNELYKRIMLEGLTDREEIARAIGKEQYDALTYHLSKEHERALELERKLLEDEEKIRLKEKKLSEDEEMLERDSKRIMGLDEELTNERRKRMDLERQLLFAAAPQKPEKPVSEGVVEDFLEDLDLADLGQQSGKQEPRAKQKEQKESEQEPELKQQPSRTVSSHVTIKDLIKLMLRVHRMRTIDASILLNTSKEKILSFVRPLARQGYIEIENAKSSDPVLRVTPKLLELRRR